MVYAGPKKSKNSHKPDLRVSKARVAALEVLSDADKSKVFARESLNSILDKHVLSSADRAFATKLVLGVVQTSITLDEVIYGCVHNKSDIKRDVMVALRISSYELLYLLKEHHAAVDQGVELVKTVQPKAKGLANLVLHKIAKKAKSFPFGDPKNELDAFCRLYSMPQWIARLMINDIGMESGQLLIASSNGQPPCYVFVNTIKSSFDDVFEIFKHNNMKPEKVINLCGVQLTNCIRVNNPLKLFSHKLKKAYNEGLFLIADSASQGISQFTLLGGKAPKRVLHVCSGKGNKTIMVDTLILHKWNTQPEFTVVDNNSASMSILLRRCEQFGVSQPKNYVGDANNLKKVLPNSTFTQKFDNVFVDAPCSGLGTLRRHPEIKQRLNKSAICKLAQQQLSILISAAQFVEPGGYLTYSTCTITKKENQEVAQNFLKTDIGHNFALIKLKLDDDVRQFYRTQTIGGLNDTHFAIQFVRKKED